MISCFVLKYFPYKPIFELATIFAKKKGGERRRGDIIGMTSFLIFRT